MKNLKQTGIAAALASGLLASGLANAIPYDLNITGGGLNLSYTDLRIGNDNFDYYKTTALADGDVTVQILFSDAAGDLDLNLYDAFTTSLGGSFTTTDNELLTYSFNAGDMFFIRVNWFANPMTGVDTDQFDPNEGFATASVLANGSVPSPATLALLGIGAAGIGYRRRKSKAS